MSSKNEEGMVNELADAIKSTSAERVTTPKHKQQKESSQSRKEVKSVHLGWMHYSTRCGKYVAVRKTRGGGMYTYTFKRTETMHDIMEKAKETFFPQGRSANGHLSVMEINLGNKNCIFELDLSVTAEDYISQHSVNNKDKKNKFYLLSKPLSNLAKIRRFVEAKDSDDDDFQNPIDP